MRRNRFLIASIICFALALLCASGLSGATYYVNTAAAAGGDGTTSDLTGAHCAWDTIADVNAATFAAGDSVLFARGCTWREQLTVPSSGSAGLPITFGAYGTGVGPIIDGSALVSTWTLGAGNDMPNGKLETWADANTPTGWTVTKAGTSTVNQESTSPQEGSFCARFDVDASSSNVRISENFTLLANTSYVLSFYYKTTSSGTCQCIVINKAGGTQNNYYLKSDGTWQAASTPVLAGATNANWTLFTRTFTSEAAGTYNIQLARDYAPSKSIYFDNVSVIVASPPANTYWATLSMAAAPVAAWFDDTLGQLQSNVAACTSAGDYYWSNNNLYIYSTAAPNTVYTTICVTLRNYCITSNGKDYLVLNGLRLRRANAANAYLDGANSAILNYCMVDDAGIYGIEGNSSGLTVALNNCLVVGAQTTNVRLDASKSTNCTIINSIVVGSKAQTYKGIRNAGTGVVTLTNSLVGGNSDQYINESDAYADGGGNLIDILPKFTSYRTTTPYFFIRIDDSAGAVGTDKAGYVQDVLNSIPASAKLVWSVNPGRWSAGERALATTMAAAGHNIAVHGWSHADLTKTVAFALASTNTTPTCDVDVATTTITLSCAEGGNIVAFDYSGNKNITDLKSAVSGKGWTITTTTGLTDQMKLSCLADTSGAQAVPYSPALDIVAPNHAFFDNEIGDAVADITSVTGTAPSVVCWPSTTPSEGAAVIDWIVANTNLLGCAGTTTDCDKFLSRVPVHRIETLMITNQKGDGSEATIRKLARHDYIYAYTNNTICGRYAHNATEFTAEQWGWYADELVNECGATISPLSTICAAVIADHATTDNHIYTKAYADISNYALLPTSPCINAGTDVGLTEDYAGNRVPKGNRPDIGAYEYPIRSKAILFIIGGI